MAKIIKTYTLSVLREDKISRFPPLTRYRIHDQNQAVTAVICYHQLVHTVSRLESFLGSLDGPRITSLSTKVVKPLVVLFRQDGNSKDMKPIRILERANGN